MRTASKKGLRTFGVEGGGRLGEFLRGCEGLDERWRLDFEKFSMEFVDAAAADDLDDLIREVHQVDVACGAAEVRRLRSCTQLGNVGAFMALQLFCKPSLLPNMETCQTSTRQWRRGMRS